MAAFISPCSVVESRVHWKPLPKDYKENIVEILSKIKKLTILFK